MYKWHDGCVLKLFRADWARTDVEHEARAASVVADAGLAPKVYDVIQSGERVGIVYERVYGTTMLHALAREPWSVLRHARLLAELHVQMHRCVGQALPSQRARLEQRVRNAPSVREAVREIALRTIASLPDDNKLCHGDFHPDNVMLSQRGPVIIDWSDVTCGNPFADVARTSLLLQVGEAPPNATLFMRSLIALLRRVFHRTYLRQYARAQPSARTQINRWLLPLAVARLDENILDERAKLMPLIEKLANNREH